jgi:hypothetical protein
MESDTQSNTQSESELSSAFDEELLRLFLANDYLLYEVLVNKLLQAKGPNTHYPMITEHLQHYGGCTHMLNSLCMSKAPHPYDIAAMLGAELMDLLVSSDEPEDLADKGRYYTLLGYAIMHRDVPVEDHDLLRDWPRIAIQLLQERKTKAWSLPGGPNVDHDIDMCIMRLMTFDSQLDSEAVVQLTWPHLQDLFSLSPPDFLYKPADPTLPHGVSREILRGRVLITAGGLTALDADKPL